MCLAAGAAAPAAASKFELAPALTLSSTRDGNLEIYLMNPVEFPDDGTNVRRLTHNADGDGFAGLSPDGKKIVFDSNRLRAVSGAMCPASLIAFVSDLFVMDTDGSGQTFLVHGSSASWSSDGKDIAFHASASGDGCPSRTDPGAAASDSDIFVANVDDLLAGVEQPRNLTDTAHKIDDDADWSPTADRIVYTAHYVGDDIPNPFNPAGQVSNSAELYLIDPDGSDRVQLTTNGYEERAPAWSPSGEKILYSCRIGGGFADLEICVIDADSGSWVQLTDNAVADIPGTWTSEEQIVFQRQLGPGNQQLFTLRPTLNPDGTLPPAMQVTFPPGLNLFARSGVLRVNTDARSEACIARSMPSHDHR
jgi:Tol biopolymer transport system component